MFIVTYYMADMVLVAGALIFWLREKEDEWQEKFMLFVFKI